MRTKLDDLIGKKEGNLIILGKLPSKNGRTVVRCRCEVCHREDYVACLTNIRQKAYQSCGCLQYQSKSKHPRWKGYGEISGALFHRIELSARERKIPFDILIAYIWDLFLEQNRKCALSGLPLSLPSCLRDYTYTASLDRKNSTQGYVKGNLQWVHKDINYMKQEYDETKFIEYCRLITKYNHE